MQNKQGFIPKRYRQPERYEMIFSSWCAVYTHPKTGVKYHVQMCPNILSTSKLVASHIKVLRQDKDCRRSVSEHLKTIKAAVAVIEKLLFSEDERGS
ncbi:MAG: hypothetical protein FWC89_05005 [Defluviitaleaceae bacterium]|nr:hypothetical protein [Defluviitaleaceae bacterium]